MFIRGDPLPRELETRPSAPAEASPSGSGARTELGVLVDRQVLALLGEIRNLRDVRRARARLLRGPVKRVRRREASPQLPRVGIECELLDDVQLIAVRRSRIVEARLNADRVDDQRVDFPSSDRMTGHARLAAGPMLAPVPANRLFDAEPSVLDRDRVAALDDAVDVLAGIAAPFGHDAREDARHRIAVADLHRVERGLAGLGEIRTAAEAEAPAAAALLVRRLEGRLVFCRALELSFLDEAQRLGPDRGLLGSARAADHARGLGIVGVFLGLAERH